jgi:hypothetical protein
MAPAPMVFRASLRLALAPDCFLVGMA